MPRAPAAATSLLLATVVLLSGWNGVFAGSDTTIDATDTVVRVIDGDTFVAQRLGRIRLADVDAPEVGDSGADEATDSLRRLIHRRSVFLDIDDHHETDLYGRYVAVVYVEHNATHLLNVNLALLEAGRVRVDDFPNEFDPGSWSRYVPRPSGVSTIDRDPERLVVLSIMAILILAAVGVRVLLRSLETFSRGGKH